MISSNRSVRVLILGGGSAGISVASRLSRKLPSGSITVVEPSDRHFYQPLWTLVGGGEADRESTVRDQADLIPRGVEWVRSRAKSIDPDACRVHLESGQALDYDVLIVAVGLALDWDRVPGLREGLGRGGVCSNYSYDTVAYTWDCIRNHREGPALFTHPSTPVKCGGAPQKILYLAVDHWKRTGVRDGVQPAFHIATPGIFAIERYAATLRDIVAREGIEVHYRHDLIELRPDRREAIFRDLGNDAEVVASYGMIHVTPPMQAPDFIRTGPLVDAAGWVDVDAKSLQHTRHENVFALGDVANLPTSKTGAAIRKQAPVVAKNVLAYLEGSSLAEDYDGYTSCPLVTGRNRLVLAEFGYDGKIMETFPFDQSKERRSMYLLKKHLLPELYWKGMLKGRC